MHSPHLQNNMQVPVLPPARYPMAALAILWTSVSVIFPSSFCRRAFSPAPVSPFVIPVPASLDTKAPMIPCMAILLVPLSLHFFASFSYFSASMLLFSFLAFSALFLPVSPLPYNLKREQLIPLPSSWLKNKGCYDFPLHDRSPKVIFQMFSYF